MGWYPNARSPRVFWAAVEGGDTLPALAHDIDAALEPLGIAKEARNFLGASDTCSDQGTGAARSAAHRRFAIGIRIVRLLPGGSLSSVPKPARFGRIYLHQAVRISLAGRMKPLLVLVVAYLVGGIPFGYLLVKLKTGEDVRSKGSGNIGATNVLRTTGRAIAVITLLLDIAKGFFAVWFAAWLTAGFPRVDERRGAGGDGRPCLSCIFEIPGRQSGGELHRRVPLFDAIALGAALILFVIVVSATRHISMGSIVAAGSLPFAVWMILHPPAPVLLASIMAAAFIIYRAQVEHTKNPGGERECIPVWKRKISSDEILHRDRRGGELGDGAFHCAGVAL